MTALSRELSCVRDEKRKQRDELDQARAQRAPTSRRRPRLRPRATPPSRARGSRRARARPRRSSPSSRRRTRPRAAAAAVRPRARRLRAARPRARAQPRGRADAEARRGEQGGARFAPRRERAAARGARGTHDAARRAPAARRCARVAAKRQTGRLATRRAERARRRRRDTGGGARRARRARNGGAPPRPPRPPRLPRRPPPPAPARGGGGGSCARRCGRGRPPGRRAPAAAVHFARLPEQAPARRAVEGAASRGEREGGARERFVALAERAAELERGALARQALGAPLAAIASARALERGGRARARSRGGGRGRVRRGRRRRATAREPAARLPRRACRCRAVRAGRTRARRARSRPCPPHPIPMDEPFSFDDVSAPPARRSKYQTQRRSRDTLDDAFDGGRRGGVTDALEFPEGDGADIADTREPRRRRAAGRVACPSGRRRRRARRWTRVGSSRPSRRSLTRPSASGACSATATRRRPRRAAARGPPDPTERRLDDGEGPFLFSEFLEEYDEQEALRRWRKAGPAPERAAPAAAAGAARVTFDASEPAPAPNVQDTVRESGRAGSDLRWPAPHSSEVKADSDGDDAATAPATTPGTTPPLMPPPPTPPTIPTQRGTGRSSC